MRHGSFLARRERERQRERERERERERGERVKCTCALGILITRHTNQAYMYYISAPVQPCTASAITGHVYIHTYTGIIKPGIETRHGVFYVFLNQAHKPGILHFTKL